MQKRAPAGASAPHDGHRRWSCDPHDMQNRASAGLAVPQLSQVPFMSADGPEEPYRRVYAARCFASL
jgi:hypothetical protein